MTYIKGQGHIEDGTPCLADEYFLNGCEEDAETFIRIADGSEDGVKIPVCEDCAEGAKAIRDLAGR
jgi:hypothetical protein